MGEFKIADIGIQASVVIDAKELNCPMPLFLIKKELCKLTPGQILQVDGTDFGSRKDISGWCERSGNKYLGEREKQGYLSFFVKKD
jgi:tRNA 2-thiouridine synthesizing protein A